MEGTGGTEVRGGGREETQENIGKLGVWERERVVVWRVMVPGEDNVVVGGVVVAEETEGAFKNVRAGICEEREGGERVLEGGESVELIEDISEAFLFSLETLAGREGVPEQECCL